MTDWHEKYKQEIIGIGYEQQRHNMEHSVDAGDAVRIFFDWHKELIITDEEADVLVALVEQDFYKEFKEYYDETR